MKALQRIREKSVFVPILLLMSIPALGQSVSGGKPTLGEMKTPVGDSKMTELERWREDLRFIKEELPKKHPGLFQRLDRDRFFAEVEKLDAALPTMTVNRAALELARIVGLARDGHTWTSPVHDPKSKFRLFPFAMYAFSDGIYIYKAPAEHGDILGAKVLKIGNYPVDEAFKMVAPYMSTDNEMGQMENVPRLLACPEVLEALGIITGPDKLTIELELNGNTFSKEVAVLPGRDNTVNAVRGMMKDWPDVRDGGSNPIPLHLKNIEKSLWYEYVPESKMLYVQMKDVLDEKDLTLEQFWDKVFAEADVKKPEKLVLDLRYNGGGNNQLVKPIIKGLVRRPDLDREGHLFVIIGRQTFSAAQNLTNMLENWTNAIFVGEPTGSHVNMYGDAVSYHLPHSGMLIRISSLYWQNMHARDNRKWTAPQIVAELSFADYVKNVDPAVAAVEIPYEKRRTLRDIALEAFRAKDLPSFSAKAVAFKNDPKNKYADVESQINGFGYDLVRMKMIEEAVNMFKLNVELYPESANAYDSLGEAYMTKGEKELAIKSYKKSLELDPGNVSAAEMIRRIESGGDDRH